MSGYLKQKLFQALHELVGAGDMDKRLTHAGNYMVHLQESNIPKEYRAEIAAIKGIMFATPWSSEQGAPRQISDEDGAKLAQRILSLFTAVMGGLQSYEGEEMTKTPREFERPKPTTTAEREARKVFRQVDAEKAMTEYDTGQKAFHKNRERLKAERLAREAAGIPVAAKIKKKGH